MIGAPTRETKAGAKQALLVSFEGNFFLVGFQKKSALSNKICGERLKV
jgi:hypothetical protein